MDIKALVDRGWEVRRQMEGLKEELGQIEEKLKKAGLEREHELLKDEDREGRRWLARGSHVVVPVVFTADKIMGTFRKDSLAHSQLRTIAGEELTQFYKFVQCYENRFDDGKKFRQQADEVLQARAPAFVTAALARDKFGVPKSDIKVAWDGAVDFVVKPVSE